MLVNLNSTPGTYALLADEPEIAVVFVHGMFGNGHSTWLNFQGLIDETEHADSWWAKCDLYFYQYESYPQIIPQAQNFRNFLHSVIDSTVLPQLIRLSLWLGGRFGYDAGTNYQIERRQYKRLVLVGHSTGAVIIREAILQELRVLVKQRISQDEKVRRAQVYLNRSPLILGASLRFFAPAHLGAICSGPLGVASNAPVIERLTAMYLRSRPLFHNIQPDSPILRSIQRETEKMYRKFPTLSGLTANSVFGTDDSIVNIGKYDHDPEVKTEYRQSHTSVCKPGPKYKMPLEFVPDANL
jgi:hypothetical protein